MDDLERLFNEYVRATTEEEYFHHALQNIDIELIRKHRHAAALLLSLETLSEKLGKRAVINVHCDNRANMLQASARVDVFLPCIIESRDFGIGGEYDASDISESIAKSEICKVIAQGIAERLSLEIYNEALKMVATFGQED